MKRILLAALLLGGCSRGDGVDDDPVTKMFESPYQLFINDAPGHSSGCMVEIEARGDAGKKSESIGVNVEVDERGSYRVYHEDGWEIVRVGAVAWQYMAGTKPKRIEAGARPDLLRDSAVVPWRQILSPFRNRLTLKRKGSKTLFESRDVDEFEISAESGGGADGGPVLESIGGVVQIDVKTGFPIGLTLDGAEWSAPAPGNSSGRVAFKVVTLSCGLKAIGKGTRTIEPPEPLASGRVSTAAPTATPAPTAAATPARPPAGTKKLGKKGG